MDALGNVPLCGFTAEIQILIDFPEKDQPQKHTFIKGQFKNEHDSSVRCCFFEGNPKFWGVDGSSLVAFLCSLSGVTAVVVQLELRTQHFSLQ